MSLLKPRKRRPDIKAFYEALSEMKVGDTLTWTEGGSRLISERAHYFSRHLAGRQVFKIKIVAWYETVYIVRVA